MKSNFRRRVFEIIDTSHANDEAHRIFNIGISILISINVLAVVLETEPSIYEPNKTLFDLFEYFSIAIFTLEYILRIWSCTVDPRFTNPITGRLRYALRFMSIIDLLAFLPFLVHLVLIHTAIIDLRFIRVVRLFRLFRLLKMGRYSQSITKLGHVINKKKEELSITLFSGVIILVMASSIMYYVEHDAQPDAFSSIPSALWWGVVTLTTVGYGDVYPKTLLGKVIGAFVAVLGIGLFALPAGIIASGFAAELEHNTPDPMICPYCGKEIPSNHEK